MTNCLNCGLEIEAHKILCEPCEEQEEKEGMEKFAFHQRYINGIEPKLYTTPEVYEIVSSKWNVDNADGSTDMFELFSKAHVMGFEEIETDLWKREVTK